MRLMWKNDKMTKAKEVHALEFRSCVDDINYCDIKVFADNEAVFFLGYYGYTVPATELYFEHA